MSMFPQAGILARSLALFFLQPQHFVASLTLSTSSGRRIEEFNVVGNLMEGRIRSLQRKGGRGVLTAAITPIILILNRKVDMVPVPTLIPLGQLPEVDIR
jgi:hypothetical protein